MPLHLDGKTDEIHQKQKGDIGKTSAFSLSREMIFCK